MNIFDLAKIEIAEMVELVRSITVFDYRAMSGVIPTDEAYLTRKHDEMRFIELKRKYMEG
ncbi:MAG: hypothetical protein ABIG67_05820 [Pseudomonadota bacterium]